jgi:hypothetical protein
MAYSGKTLKIRLIAAAAEAAVIYKCNSLLHENGLPAQGELHKAIKSLHKAGLITDEEREFLDIIRKNGNASKHEFEGAFFQKYKHQEDLADYYQHLGEKWVPGFFHN